MARTKQTARKCMGGKGIAAGPVRAPHRYRPGAVMVGGKGAPSPVVAAVSDEEVLDTQQFSIKFDDQAECEKKAVRSVYLRCG